MNNRKGYIQWLLLAASITALGFSLYNFRSHDRTGWIDIHKVYNGFEYKKELEKKVTQVQQSRKNILDSLEFDLQLLAKQIRYEKKKPTQQDVAVFQVRRDDYLKKKKQFDEDNQVMVQQYDEQILNQLNQYVKDYAKQEGYDFIYAADGSGTIMAAPEHNNMTDEVTRYINDRYKGGDGK